MIRPKRLFLLLTVCGALGAGMGGSWLGLRLTDASAQADPIKALIEKTAAKDQAASGASDDAGEEGTLPSFVPEHQALSLMGQSDPAAPGSQAKPRQIYFEPMAPSSASLPPAEPAKPQAPQLIAAKTLFGAAKTGSPLAARAIGSYSRGCLSGGVELASDGPAWQAMRLSRGRRWGHPKLIALVERLAKDAQAKDGWPGLLVGDIAQPRGGPMLSGHASHQIGLDADVWLTPMPDRKFTNKEREEISATSMLDKTDIAVDPKIFTDKHVALIKRAASYVEVERIFVHPAIKKALCEAAGTDRRWLGKVRPMGGHYYHFHIRMKCQPGLGGCEPQTPPSGDDGCGKEVEQWLARLTPPKTPPPPRPPGYKPPPPKPPITMAQLPKACLAVLESGPGGVPVPAEAFKLPSKGKAAPAPAVASTGESKANPTQSTDAKKRVASEKK